MNELNLNNSGFRYFLVNIVDRDRSKVSSRSWPEVLLKFVAAHIRVFVRSGDSDNIVPPTD